MESNLKFHLDWYDSSKKEEFSTFAVSFGGGRTYVSERENTKRRKVTHNTSNPKRLSVPFRDNQNSNVNFTHHNNRKNTSTPTKRIPFTTTNLHLDHRESKKTDEEVVIIDDSDSNNRRTGKKRKRESLEGNGGGGKQRNGHFVISPRKIGSNNPSLRKRRDRVGGGNNYGSNNNMIVIPPPRDLVVNNKSNNNGNIGKYNNNVKISAPPPPPPPLPPPNMKQKYNNNIMKSKVPNPVINRRNMKFQGNNNGSRNGSGRGMNIGQRRNGYPILKNNIQNSVRSPPRPHPPPNIQSRNRMTTPNQLGRGGNGSERSNQKNGNFITPYTGPRGGNNSFYGNQNRGFSNQVVPMDGRRSNQSNQIRVMSVKQIGEVVDQGRKVINFLKNHKAVLNQIFQFVAVQNKDQVLNQKQEFERGVVMFDEKQTMFENMLREQSREKILFSAMPPPVNNITRNSFNGVNTSLPPPPPPPLPQKDVRMEDERRGNEPSGSNVGNRNPEQNFSIVREGYSKSNDSNYGKYGYGLLPRDKDFRRTPTSFEMNGKDDKLLKDKDFISNEYSWSEDMYSYANGTFGITDFRPLQKEAINAAIGGKDVFLIMPTGGGKSLCFQVPGVICVGVTIVVSPLISLIQDQTMNLKSRGVENAFYIKKGMSWEEVLELYNYIKSKARTESSFLYVTPERIAQAGSLRNLFRTLYSRNLLSRFVIDESHCLSTWGHDFRPDYKELSILRRDYRNVPIIAMTATATYKVRNDVKRILGMRECVQLIGNFNRENLHFIVQKKEGSKDKVADQIFQFIKSFKYERKSGIVYCLSRNDCKMLSDKLTEKGLSCDFYHAGREASDKERIHRDWQNDRIRIICATIAFGMGIDKPDVRFVIHHSMSKSIEGYYQESGRAGRDGGKSHCLLLYSYHDKLRLFNLQVKDDGGNFKSQSTIREFAKDLNLIESYCCNNSDCRRSLLVKHFDSGSKIKCDDVKCDNCGYKKTLTTVDVTKIARDVSECLKELNFQKTRRYIAKYLWGSKGSFKISKDLPKKLYGSYKSYNGSKMTITNLSKIILHLIHEGYVDEQLRGFERRNMRLYSVIGIKDGNNKIGKDKKIKFSFREDSALKLEKIFEKDIMKRKTNRKLRNELEKVRGEIARNQRLANFFVLSDKDIDDLIEKPPKKIEDLVKFIPPARICRYKEIPLRVLRVFIGDEYDSRKEERIRKDIQNLEEINSRRRKMVPKMVIEVERERRKVEKMKDEKKYTSRKKSSDGSLFRKKNGIGENGRIRPKIIKHPMHDEREKKKKKKKEKMVQEMIDEEEDDETELYDKEDMNGYF